MSYFKDGFKAELIEQVKDLVEIYNALKEEHGHEKDIVVFNLAIVAGTLALYWKASEIPVLNQAESVLQANHEQLRKHFLSKKKSISDMIYGFLKDPTEQRLKDLNEIFVVAEWVDEEEAFLDDFDIASKTLKCFSEQYAHLSALAKKLKTEYRFFDDDILDNIC